MAADDAQRARVVADAGAHERELSAALSELRRAVEQPFASLDQVAMRIARHPVRCLLAAVLAGMWLGRR